jgi:hypothetical protein
MRSEVIFQAQEKIANRYRLCHAVAKVTRRLHFSSANTEDAIRDAFVKVARVRCLAEDTGTLLCMEIPGANATDTRFHFEQVA